MYHTMNQPASVQAVDISSGRRIIAVSDVHGHASYLRALLEKVRFCAQDVLVIVGDILERGAENLETLRYVMSLREQYTVYQLIGNVDGWALNKPFTLDAKALVEDVRRFTEWHGGSFIDDLCREMGIALTEKTDIDGLRQKITETFADEYAYMRTLPTVIDTPQARFVHGGMDNIALTQVPDFPMHRFTKRDAFAEEGLRFDKHLVVGHWPVCLYSTGRTQFSPVIHEAQRIISIDGGCGVKREGQLNALILQDGRIEWDSYDDLPVRIALDAQRSSDVCHAITYMNGTIDVLEWGDDAAHVAHLPSGYTMWVPRTRLYHQDGVTRCNDISDYRLNVSPGDKLTVVEETSIGAYCRKLGVMGWYSGRFEG